VIRPSLNLINTLSSNNFHRSCVRWTSSNPTSIYKWIKTLFETSFSFVG